MTDRSEAVLVELVPELRAKRLPLSLSSPKQESNAHAMSPVELKAEAVRLFPLTGMGKRACFRAFGVPYETGREWIDPAFQKKCPREDFVLWLGHIVAAKSLVRVA